MHCLRRHSLFGVGGARAPPTPVARTNARSARSVSQRTKPWYVVSAVLRRGRKVEAVVGERSRLQNGIEQCEGECRAAVAGSGDDTGLQWAVRGVEDARWLRDGAQIKER